MKWQKITQKQANTNNFSKNQLNYPLFFRQEKSADRNAQKKDGNWLFLQ